MAFEKIEIGGSYSDFATWLASQQLGWFDSVTTPQVGDIACFINSAEYMHFYPSSVSFSPTGQIGVAGSGFSSNGKNTYGYGYKSKNGILLSYIQSAPQFWIYFGLTADNKKCFMSGNGNGALSVKIAAFDETSNSFHLPFIASFTGKPTAWSDSPQIVTSAIPTHPASGTRFVKNAILILSAPFQNDGWQKIRIGDTVYMTNGYVAFSDE